MTATIILPVWNAQKYVETCINSIQAQTLQDFECIIVDDGSTDDTLLLVQNLIKSDKRFKAISLEHHGLSNARNAGIEMASSDIIFHIDVDDYAKPEMMEHAVSFMNENSLDMVLFDANVQTSDASDDAMYRFKVESRYFLKKNCYGISSGREMLRQMIKANEYVYAVFLQAIRKSAIKRMFQYGLRAQDLLYSTQNIILQERVGHLKECLYVKQCRKDSVSASRKDAHYVWSIFRTIIELIKFAEEEPIDDSVDLIERIISDLFSNIVTAFKQFTKDDWQYIKEKSLFDKTILGQFAKFALIY